jgi:hypothetical protein
MTRDIGALRSMESGSDKFNDQGPAAEAQHRDCTPYYYEYILSAGKFLVLYPSYPG